MQRKADCRVMILSGNMTCLQGSEPPCCYVAQKRRLLSRLTLDSTSIQECYEGSLASRGNHTHLSPFFTEIFQRHGERYHKDTKTSYLGHVYLSGNHAIANGIEDDLRKPFQTV